ncbi:MAG: pentapeptide repeat-containing protein [Bryobacteraceae bacterium]|jgi:hypothetical protein
MANPEHVAIIKMGTEVWNRWRSATRWKSNDPHVPDLSGANLSGLDISGADLEEVNLREADLSNTNLSKAFLGAGLRVRRASPGEVTLQGRPGGEVVFEAGFTLEVSPESGGADLGGANLRHADLSGAELCAANLYGADLTGAKLSDAAFSASTVWPDGYEPIAHGAIPLLKSFNIAFDEALSPEQARATLVALADYYRACGGLGFRVHFELDDVLVREPVHA